MSQTKDFEKIINEYVKENEKNPLNAEKILTKLFEETYIKERYLNEIRRSSIIGHIANEILTKIGSQETIDIKAIGDIDYPSEFMTKWENICQNALNRINTKNLIGYDINAQGTNQNRLNVYNFMNDIYKLEESEKENIITNTIFCYGGTDGFNTIIDTFNTIFPHQTTKFIFPESSFMANVEIAKNKLGANNLIKITKPSKDDFFMTFEQIKEISKGQGSKIFYITPVGNPTGQLIPKENLIKTIKEITTFENNFIILDNVYINLLKKEVSQDYFQQLFTDTKIKNQLIVSESLSKTFGTTGIRIGWIWGFNSKLLLEIKKINSLMKAGFSKILLEFLDNLLIQKKELNDFQEKIFEFWSQERINFLNHIKTNHLELFDFEYMAGANQREGIYLLVKIKDGLTPSQVFAKTKTIGVANKLSDGTYIRYAFGNVK